MQTWMGREVRVNGTGGDVTQAVPEPCPSILPCFPAEGISSPHLREYKRDPQIHECQGTGKGMCFETFVDMNVFRRPQSSLLTAKEHSSACPTQMDLVFHPVHGHNPESHTLSNGVRLVPQQLSIPALTLGTVWSSKLCSCPCAVQLLYDGWAAGCLIALLSAYERYRKIYLGTVNEQRLMKPWITPFAN